jgi:hypothetical protein
MTLKHGDLDTELTSTGLNKMRIRHVQVFDSGEFILEGNRVVALHMKGGDRAIVEFRKK